MKNARSTEVKASALSKRRNSTSSNPFSTDNLRQLRILAAAVVRSRTREEVDRITGSSNGPDVIAQLRRKGLEFPCTMISDTDRDGLPIRRGVYNLTDKDRRKVLAMNRSRGRA